jgi:hypothetical protein
MPPAGKVGTSLVSARFSLAHRCAIYSILRQVRLCGTFSGAARRILVAKKRGEDG